MDKNSIKRCAVCGVTILAVVVSVGQPLFCREHCESAEFDLHKLNYPMQQSMGGAAVHSVSGGIDSTSAITKNLSYFITGEDSIKGVI